MFGTLHPHFEGGEAKIMTGNTIWLVERNRLFRQGLALLLRNTSFEVAREISELGEVAIDPGASPPAIILVSIETVLGEGSEEKRELERICALPGVSVIVLSESLSVGQLTAAMRAGAKGYLLKDISSDVLAQSLRLVLSGEKVLPSTLVQVLLNGVRRHANENMDLRRPDLSPTDEDILRYLARGYSNKQIARELDVTENAVKFTVKKIFRKIEARNRTEAAIWALQRMAVMPSATN
jgi:two-component system nitrate/nitrite response regulator NarL